MKIQIPPSGRITANGQERQISGLPLIFEQCAAGGVPADGGDGAILLNAVKLYHRVAREEESEYQKALFHAYKNFRSGIRPER